MKERGRYNRLERERLNGKRIRDRREERKINIGGKRWENEETAWKENEGMDHRKRGNERMNWTYIYIYIYTHTYIHTYIHRETVK